MPRTPERALGGTSPLPGSPRTSFLRNPGCDFIKPRLKVEIKSNGSLDGHREAIEFVHYGCFSAAPSSLALVSQAPPAKAADFDSRLNPAHLPRIPFFPTAHLATPCAQRNPPRL